MTEPTNEELMKAAVQRSHEMYKLNTSRAAFQAGVLFAIAKPGPPPAVAGEQTMADVIAACNGTEAFGLIMGLRAQVAMLESVIDEQKASAKSQPTQAQTADYIRNKKAIKSTATR